MVLGIGGLSGGWRAATRVWGVSAAVGEALALLAIALWLLWIVLFGFKWLRFRNAAETELFDPIQSFFVVLVPMTTMIVSIAARPYVPGIAWCLFLMAAIFQIGFTAWVTGNVWLGGRSLETVTPATYMPSVGGFFVSALTAGTFGHAELGLLFWGAGFISWLVWESVVLHRLMTDTLPVNLRATLGIHLTPPAIACAAYLSITDGAPDRLAQAIFGYALLQGITMLRIVPWLREQAFSPAVWAFTFGIAALPLAAIRFVERGQTGPIAAVALPLFIFANVVIGWIAARTVYLALKGKLFAG